MKTLLEIKERFVRSAERQTAAGRYAMGRDNAETADVIAEAIRRDEYRGTTNTELGDRIVMLKRSLADNSKIAQEAEAWATKLRGENSAMRAREVFLSNQNSCLRDEVRTLREEIAVNRGKNERLMKELDTIAPFRWEYTPDGTGGSLKRREILTPDHPVYHGATTSRSVPADFSQIEGRVRRWVASGRSKFERGQLVNVVRGGFHLYRVKIVSVIFFTPEAPNGILGSNAPVEGEELGVKYLVRYNTTPNAYRDREVWAWMLELCPSRYEGESSGQPETF